MEFMFHHSFAPVFCSITQKYFEICLGILTFQIPLHLEKLLLVTTKPAVVLVVEHTRKKKKIKYISISLLHKKIKRQRKNQCSEELLLFRSHPYTLVNELILATSYFHGLI